MANLISSKYEPVQAGRIRSAAEQVKLSFPVSWTEFLLQYNVGVPEHRDFNKNGLEFSVQHFLGFSKNDFEDFGYVFDFYEGRIPDEYIPVAIAEGGNLVCMDTNSGFIYYWDHEIHDSGDDEDDDEPLNLVAGSLDDFLDELVTIPINEEDLPPQNPENAAKIKKSDDFDELFKDYKI